MYSNKQLRKNKIKTEMKIKSSKQFYLPAYRITHKKKKWFLCEIKKNI